MHRGKLLIEKEVLQRLLISAEKDSRVSLGCTLTGDGWTNTQNKSLLNFIVATPGGPVFEEFVDTSGNERNGQYIADEFIKSLSSSARRVSFTSSQTAQRLQVSRRFHY